MQIIIRVNKQNKSCENWTRSKCDRHVWQVATLYLWIRSDQHVCPIGLSVCLWRQRLCHNAKGAVNCRVSVDVSVSVDCWLCIPIRYYLQLHKSRHSLTNTHHTHTGRQRTETDWLQLQRIPSPASAYLCTSSNVAACLANVWEQSGPCLAGSVNELFVGRCYARHACTNHA